MERGWSAYIQRLSASVGLGLLALAGLLLLLSQHPHPALADPGDLFVTPDGAGVACIQSTPCSLQTALGKATAGDTIFVAQGTYTGTDAAVASITQSITLYGGWDGSLTGDVARDPAAHPTTLNGERGRRVISITGDISPTIEGFVITGGDATGLGGIPPGGQDAGGGIYCYLAHPTIANNVITDNVASSGTSVGGGGIHLERCHRAIVDGNTIVSNTASTGGFGRGGGVSLDYSDATLSGNVVVSNTASNGNVGYGGGLYLYSSDATLSGNRVEGNVGGTASNGRGGGMYIQYGIVTVSANTVRGNVARAPNLGVGGGFYVVYGDALTLDGNWIMDNAADRGGGMYVSQGSTLTLTNSVIAGNRAASSGDGLYILGSAAYPSIGTLLHNTIADNTGRSGEGLRVRDYIALTLTSNVIAGHTVGVTNTNPASSTVTADHTLFHGNTKDHGGVSSTGEVSGDPHFVNPASFDYHVGPNSAAIDAGITVTWVTADIDGDPRPWPIGGEYDVGADEAWWRHVYLPLALRNY